MVTVIQLSSSPALLRRMVLLTFVHFDRLFCSQFNYKIFRWSYDISCEDTNLRVKGGEVSCGNRYAGVKVGHF